MPPPPTVTVAAVEERELIETDEFTGRIEAVESVEIRARVSGYLLEIRFQAGQKVKKGDVLFVIDPRQRKADVLVVDEHRHVVHRSAPAQG